MAIVKIISKLRKFIQPVLIVFNNSVLPIIISTINEVQKAVCDKEPCIKFKIIPLRFFIRIIDIWWAIPAKPMIIMIAKVTKFNIL